MTDKPALLLLPNLLGDHRYAEVFLPNSINKAMMSIDGVIAESETEGRRYLKRFETKKPAIEIPIALYNEHVPDNQIDFLLEPIKQGQRWGLVSDAGLPCIADPGSKIVLRARQCGLTVQAFVGPSSIMMALMLSGLSGQKFTFHGYLDKSPEKRQKQIVQLMNESKSQNCTQIFMEAPYRNKHLLDALLATLSENTLLCVAWNLTLSDQGVITQSIAQWKKCTLPTLDKKPAIFLMATV